MGKFRDPTTGDIKHITIAVNGDTITTNWKLLAYEPSTPTKNYDRQTWEALCLNTTELRIVLIFRLDKIEVHLCAHPSKLVIVLAIVLQFLATTH